MSRIHKDKNNMEFRFLNERVIKYQKKDIVRLVSIIVACAMIFGIVACVTFLWAKPYLKGYFKENPKSGGNQKLENTNGDDAQNGTTTGEDTKQNISSETISDNEEETEPLLPTSQEEMRQSVVMLSAGSFEQAQSDKEETQYITSGLVLKKSDKIQILTSYEKVKGLKTVIVNFESGKSYEGIVKTLSQDYKIAIVEVDGTNIPEDEATEIRTAVLNGETKLYVSEQITFIGNPIGKKIFEANGALTLVGNTVSIMDAETEIITTNIEKVGEVNGFVFDTMGQVIGMVMNDFVGNDEGDNIVSMVRISDLKPYIDRMLEGKAIPYIGIYGREVTDEVIKNIDNEMPYGIYIYNTKENSPAYLSGILNGDVLVAINDNETLNFQEYVNQLLLCEAGYEITMTVMRKGKDGYKRIQYTVTVDGA